jgi:hypothetical protein|tara:strand:- start:114 stop:353 length:240 start_codon:yes stop_codon:yes gene_type:complete
MSASFWSAGLQVTAASFWYAIGPLFHFGLQCNKLLRFGMQFDKLLRFGMQCDKLLRQCTWEACLLDPIQRVSVIREIRP